MLSSAQRGHAGVVARALDDDLVGADAGHHVVDAVAPLVEVAFDLQGGEPVGNDADPPARSVGPRAEVAVGEDLGRRLVLVPLAERADRRRSAGRGASDLKSWGRLARSCAMITQRPTIGSFRSSGMVGLLTAACDARLHSHLPHDPLEIGDGDRQLEDPLARGSIEAGVSLEQLDVEPDRVAGLAIEPRERDGQLEDRCRSRPATVVPLADGSARVVEVGRPDGEPPAPSPRSRAPPDRRSRCGADRPRPAARAAGPPSVSIRIRSRSASNPNQTHWSRPLVDQRHRPAVVAADVSRRVDPLEVGGPAVDLDVRGS